MGWAHNTIDPLFRLWGQACSIYVWDSLRLFCGFRNEFNFIELHKARDICHSRNNKGVKTGVCTSGGYPVV
ncbi:hypothetical protein I79_000579 [Cricetulus griseus]|uniref:Uncharacterized protein n=1 Tax=Cricetulus griseus TaxID=10029 RepID=G3GSG7_CRIGR|nr:hypothetical protein I79_000579 [Cricetulus griseus]